MDYHSKGAPGYEEKDGSPTGSVGWRDHTHGRQFSITGENSGLVEADVNELHRGLSGFHTSMIAIGGAIGAGLFVSVGGAFSQGGPASVLIGFMIIGLMMLMVMQALGELAVLYPQNGAFTAYIIRFIDPSWGFAMGWIYAISWLTVLPFELTAAGLTIKFWQAVENINIGVWIAVFLVALFVIQFFGVRAYGYSEVFLSFIKVAALTGFCIFAIVDNVGGVSTDPRGYIGARYWQNGLAFQNGFHGFCSVFVTAAFAFGGTELVGLTAAENKNPGKQLPKAIRQTVWRIVLFYLVSLFLVGLLVPADDPNLLNAGSASTKYSSFAVLFVISFVRAGVKGLPSVFNVVICLTFQAMAGMGMLPKFLAYVDKKGRPIPTIILQLIFAMLAFINEASATGSLVFGWLLALTAIAYFFVWGSICAAHLRFRWAWKHNGRSLDELTYRAAFGTIGSWIGLVLNILSLTASIYIGVAPVGGSWSITGFFEQCLALPCVVFFYLVWKGYSWFAIPQHRRMWVNLEHVDIYAGMREDQLAISGPHVPDQLRLERIQSLQDSLHEKKTGMARVKAVVTSCI
ncbi:hypothetical protein LTR62_006162 [Meristemomyces frigidus]|uniref:Amino acid permease/ SLC12A domain-containing protein n=1 Tax=Meristemomyces frigidus TaxID=1508187 RepID=A0AAN7TCI6_9PEZI|nr:hypothetical protein LTR62_006162 [Meristemomyces frigidus]